MEARRLPAYLPKTAKNNLYLEILEALKGWLTVKSNPEISEALKRKVLRDLRGPKKGSQNWTPLVRFW